MENIWNQAPVTIQPFMVAEYKTGMSFDELLTAPMVQVGVICDYSDDRAE